MFGFTIGHKLTSNETRKVVLVIVIWARTAQRKREEYRSSFRTRVHSGIRAGSNLLFQFWLATFFPESFHENLVSILIRSFFIVCIKRKRKKAPSPSRYCPSTPFHQHGHVPATPQSLNEIVAHRLSNNAREFLTLVLRVICLSEADAVPLVKLHDRRKLGEGHLLPWDHVRHLKQAADAILLLGRSRSYGSPDGRAPQDFVYRSRQLSLKRNAAFLWMSDFECLTMLSFLSALPVMPCTNAPVLQFLMARRRS